jgi:DNA polymerase
VMLLAHLLAEHGVSLPDLKKDTLLRRLDDESLPAVARELIELRLESNKTSTAKYRRLVESISTDGRLRNTLQMYGAARTGRFAGRVFQPHNLPRPTLKSGMIEEGIEAAIGGMLPLWLSDQPGLEAFAFASNAIRGVVTAPPGKKLVVSDWANIEGRVAAAIAGEEWKILAFLEFDALVGPDLYLLSYARSFGLDVADVPEDGPERQMGKVQELSLQYEGGGNAFASMAAVYRMDLRAMADAVREVADPEVWKNAEGFVGWMKQHKKPLPSEDMEVCAACEVVKSGWRENHPAIVGLWRELSHAWRLAAHNPGKEFTAGPNGLLKFYHRAGWLRIVLPSGRSLVYMHPRADEDGGLRFTGLNPYTQKWGTVHTFGGKLFENIVQAVSADVLIEALHRVDPVMPVVLHVHDEIITEVDDTPEYTPEKLSAIMCEKVPWLPELPLAAKGFETYRYRKG